MCNIEWIDDRNDDFWKISEELWNLKENLEKQSEIETIAKNYWIPSDIANEYIGILKDFYASNKIQLENEMDKKLLRRLGVEEWELSNWDCIIFYFIKKCCPTKYKNVAKLFIKMFANEWIWITPGRLNIKYGNADPNLKTQSQYSPIKDVMRYIEIYGDDVCNILKFCSPFDNSYLKTSILKFTFEDKDWHNWWWDQQWSESESRAMLTQFFENFIYEPESLNLLNFLKEDPQTLNNLWWKEIKSINLSLDSGINFAFRGIIEMVKSRSDINFPHLNDNATESEKNLWKLEWGKIIKEYENMLRNYIAKDFQEWKGEFENRELFDRIFFTMPNWDEVVDDSMPLPKNRVQQFSWNDILNYSFDAKKDQEKTKNEVSTRMLGNIENYVKEHPNEKILICVVQHGNPDGSSWNWWTKEDWLRLANLSENVKIWSIRCYFWTAFDNKDIYNHKASVSGFSNLSTASASVSEAVNWALNKWLWFHEMEIYTRLNYPISVAPLTESMEYINWNTWESEIWKIGLAQNNVWQGDNNDKNYA